MKFVLIFFILLFSIVAEAQQNDTQLAYTYYQNKEYEKAAQLFFQLYERNRSDNYLDYCIICLINGKQYDKAENTLKKFLKSDEKNKNLLFNLGYIYEQQGKNSKSEEYYEKAIKILIPTNSDINSLANKFRNVRKYDWAIKTYLHGREILKQPNGFLKELGENYMMERNYKRMFELFIQNLQQNPAEINQITSKLSFARANDLNQEIDPIIETHLMEIFKQQNYSPIFDELAVWYATQKKDYRKALQYATSLNQKMTNKQHLFMNIARDASDMGYYEVAIESYQKILEAGKEMNHFYPTASKEILVCKYKQQIASNTTSFQEIVKACESFLQTYGYSAEHIDLNLLLSEIYAYHLHLPNSANQILEKSIAIRQLNHNTRNLLKSKRADLLTFMDKIWEATILYTQIEKSVPNHDIGYEAKLKKAWLAYYTGDLLWAKAQFDVLKGSTTKLIANDALKMSHFINMNYTTETNQKDLEKLAKTEYLIYKQKFKEALPVLDSLIDFSQQGISDYATLEKVKLLTQKNDYAEAMALLEKLKNKSRQTYIQAEAIYQLAKLKEQQQEYAQAKELYKTLITDYSGSVYSIEASKQYREMEHKK